MAIKLNENTLSKLKKVRTVVAVVTGIIVMVSVVLIRFYNLESGRASVAGRSSLDMPWWDLPEYLGIFGPILKYGFGLGFVLLMVLVFLTTRHKDILTRVEK